MGQEPAFTPCTEGQLMPLLLPGPPQLHRGQEVTPPCRHAEKESPQPSLLPKAAPPSTRLPQVTGRQQERPWAQEEANTHTHTLPQGP